MNLSSILPAIITGGLALVGVIITNMNSNKQIENKLVTAQAVTDTKIEHLTEEIRKHNNFAARVPVLEEQVRDINHRVDNIERHIQDDHK